LATDRHFCTVARLLRAHGCAAHERQAGLRAALRSMLRATSRTVVAVSNVSFAVRAGEVVGFLGPNGAGKTTMLKVLSGLLYPASGEAHVLGFLPARRERAFLRQITLVAGNRNQLVWDLPVGDRGRDRAGPHAWHGRGTGRGGA
jgi:ABC-2 type transport system ATP-binding protein